MADLKSLESLIQQVSDNARGQIAAELRPHVQAIAAAAAAMEAALGGGRRRGRRPKGAAAPTASTSTAPKKRGRKAGGKKVKRGALVGLLKTILSGAGKGMKAADLRNAVAQEPEYRGRDPKTLYSQVMQTLGRIPEVVKSGDGAYSIKGGKK